MSGGSYLQHLVLAIMILLVLKQRIVDSNIIRCIEEEREALLDFKQGLVDEYGILSSWGKEDDKKECCKWSRVVCNNRTGHVNMLDLRPNIFAFPRKTLRGTISPALIKLHHLSYLDLSFNNFSGSLVPDFIGSFTKLRVLYLVGAGFGGPIPHQLGNLSRLQSLYLNFNPNLFCAGNLEWLSHLSSLMYLHLSWNDLSKSNDWFQQVGKLPFLKRLLLNRCNLQPIIPSSLLLVNSTASLEVLELSDNNLTSSINSWLFNVSSNLVELDLSKNNLKGPIPDAIGNMIYLGYLSFESNDLEGGIPKFFGNMCALYSLDLSSNNLSGFIQNLLGKCTEIAMEVLSLSGNKFMGSMPDLTRFSSLNTLNLEKNRLNGTLSKSIGHMSKLESLLLSDNLLRGVVPEAFFSNLSNLRDLDLTGNSLALEIRHDWIPPFQPVFIGLGSCKMGPHFPKWLQSLKILRVIDISNAGISDTLPDWFWDQSAKQFSLVNLSHNQIKGRLPDIFSNISSDSFGIDINSNQFEGPIPALPSYTVFLDLSKNKFLGTISFLCSLVTKSLSYIDLSSNLLSGPLPDCWKQIDGLTVLNLANNSFFGNIPHLMGALSEIQTLSLRNNSFSGDLPSSLKNCTQLRVLDLGMNALSGNVPAWIGESLPNLVILSLQSNRFLGNIPFQLCHLADIQILDLSSNNISGTIPNCVNNFTAMTQERSFNATIAIDYSFTIPQRGLGWVEEREYSDSSVLTWKGNEYEYKNTLGLVKMLDLSSNELGGTVPGEITTLVGLIALNLSRNHLTGQINQKIGQLELLDFLDLSRNQFSGEIPSSLSRLNRLSVLDLAYNDLSGKIPLGTQLQSFNASMYAGNPRLCGLPLPNKCSWEEPVRGPTTNTPKDADQFITLGFYVSMVLGFIAGFWGVFGTLQLNSSWRHAYFNFLTNIGDRLYVTAALTIARLQRRLGN